MKLHRTLTGSDSTMFAQTESQSLFYSLNLSRSGRPAQKGQEAELSGFHIGDDGNFFDVNVNFS